MFIEVLKNLLDMHQISGEEFATADGSGEAGRVNQSQRRQ